jgi:hypothetical protein
MHVFVDETKDGAYLVAAARRHARRTIAGSSHGLVMVWLLRVR